MTRGNPAAFVTTLTPELQAAVAAHGWATGHYLLRCSDCTPERNVRHARGDFGTAADSATRCREHALEAALRAAHAAAPPQDPTT